MTATGFRAVPAALDTAASELTGGADQLSAVRSRFSTPVVAAEAFGLLPQSQRALQAHGTSLQTSTAGEAVSAFLDAAERVGEHPPYGIGEKEWDHVVELVDQLIDLFHADGPPEEITELAYQLRRRLRPLV